MRRPFRTVSAMAIAVFTLVACSESKTVGHVNISKTLKTGEEQSACMELRPGDELAYNYEADDVISFHVSQDGVVTYRFQGEAAEDLDMSLPSAGEYCLYWKNTGQEDTELTYQYEYIQHHLETESTENP